MAKEDKIEVEGKVTEVLKGGEYLVNLPKFQNDLTLAQFCISGGLDKKSGKYYAAPNWATGYAHKRGWKPNLDLRLEVNRQINDLWNPTKIIGYAKKLLNAIRDRKSLLQTCQSKYEATKKLVDKFNKVKTIIFSESTDFADNVAKLLETKHKVVVYHSNIKTVIKPSPKTGKPIKVGKTRLKREATESIRNGKARIIVTAKSLDKGFDVVDLRFGITASGTQNPTQYKQRGGRVKRKETEQIFKTNFINGMVQLVPVSNHTAMQKIEQGMSEFAKELKKQGF